MHHIPRPQRWSNQIHHRLIPERHYLFFTLYEAPSHSETFEQRRDRINRQEALNFAPVRHRPRPSAAPYDPAHRSTISTDDPPLLLDRRSRRAWLPATHRSQFRLLGLPAGCLIRHHVVPRRGRMPLAQLPTACPITVDKLDNIRVTLVHGASGKSRLYADDGVDSSAPQDVNTSWTGATIFQINGHVQWTPSGLH